MTNHEVERLARKMMKLEQGDRPVTANILAHYICQAGLACRAIEAIEKEKAAAPASES